MLSGILLVLAFQSPTVLQSAADGYPLLGKLRFTEGVEKTTTEIVLESEDGQVLDRTTSSPNGDFRFRGVKLGRYWLVIEGEKFQNVRERLEVDIRTFGVINVTLVLRPRMGVKPAGPAEDVVSVDMLRRKVPKDALKEYERGVEEQKKGDGKKAVDHFQRAVKIAPDFYEGHLQLGLQLQKSGMRDDAMRSFEKAVALNPASVSGRTSLGRLYLESEQFQKAVETENESIKIAPASADAYFILGTAYYKLNSLALAEENLQRAVTMAPATMGAAHLQLYNVYMRSRRPVEALEQLDTYLTSFPTASNHQTIQEQADKLRQMLKR